MVVCCRTSALAGPALTGATGATGAGRVGGKAAVDVRHDHASRLQAYRGHGARRAVCLGQARNSEEQIVPAISVAVRDGDPTVQASGEHRGMVSVTFSDGRVIERSVRAPSADAWADRIANIQSRVEEDIASSDAEEAVREDAEILEPYKEASLPQMALAYLRNAMRQGDPYVAYMRFSRFNDYRLAQGWNLDQVASVLAGVGLASEEWSDMKDRFQYLSNAARVTAMQAYQGVLEGDIWGQGER